MHPINLQEGTRSAWSFGEDNRLKPSVRMELELIDFGTATPLHRQELYLPSGTEDTMSTSPAASALDLARFLGEQTAEGQVESHGEFTLSQDKAARKLGRFSLPFDYAWVLKIVQAVVRWKCQGLEVRQHRTFTRFEFRPARLDQMPTEETLVNTLLAARFGGDQPVELLCLALRALVEQSDLSFVFICDTGGEDSASRPIQAGRDAAALAREAHNHRLPPFVGMRLLIAHLPLGRFFMGRMTPKSMLNERPDLGISQALQKHCYLSPVPIRVDGRELTDVMANPLFGASARMQPMVLSGLPSAAAPTFPPAMPIPASFEEKIFSLRTHPRRALRAYGGTKRLAVWFLARSIAVRGRKSWNPHRDAPGLAPPHQHVLFVRFGVVVERLKVKCLTSQTELFVFINADRMKTDLSGLALIIEDPARPELREILRRVADKLSGIGCQQLVREDRDELSSFDQPNPMSARGVATGIRAALGYKGDDTFALPPEEVEEAWCRHWKADIEVLGKLHRTNIQQVALE